MNTKISHPVTAGFLAAAMVFLTVANDVQAGANALATQPFTSTNAVTALPNVLFVLDDSLSKETDFFAGLGGAIQEWPDDQYPPTGFSTLLTTEWPITRSPVIVR